MKHLMIDLETLGRDDDAVIVSIGAVKFDPNGVNTEDTFYRVVDFEHCPFSKERSIDPSIVKWWMTQSGEAREVFEQSGDSLLIAITAFQLWAAGIYKTEELNDEESEILESSWNDNLVIWGNGSDFDNRIMGDACEQLHGIATVCEWKFWNNRCYRTVKNVYKDVPKPERIGVHHNAVDDAQFQAEHLVAIAKANPDAKIFG